MSFAPMENLAAILRNAHAAVHGRPVRRWEFLPNAEQYKWHLIVEQVALEQAADPLFELSGQWLYTTWIETLLISATPFAFASAEQRQRWNMIAAAANGVIARRKAA